MIIKFAITHERCQSNEMTYLVSQHLTYSYGQSHVRIIVMLVYYSYFIQKKSSQDSNGGINISEKLYTHGLTKDFVTFI